MLRSKKFIANSEPTKGRRSITIAVSRNLRMKSKRAIIKYKQRDVDKLLRQNERYLKCWKVGLSFGSMVIFKMGDRLDADLIRGSVVEIGTSTLVLEADEWRFFEGVRQVADAD